MTYYGDLTVKDVDKLQVNSILINIYEEEAISDTSIWWEDLVDTYNRNICVIYMGYKLSKIIASYYVVQIYIRGFVSDDNSLISNGRLSLSRINAVEGYSVNLAKDYLQTIV